MNSKENFADLNGTKLVNKINDLTIGEDTTDLLVVNSNVNATNGLDVTGAALTITNQAITQTGSGQVTFMGNVGIGQTIPVEKLDVSGNIKAAGSKISGSIVQTQHLNYVYEIFETYTNSGFTDFDNSGFVVSINPTSTNSKLLFNCNIHIGIDRSQDSRWYGIRLYRKIGNGNWTFLQGASGDNGNPGGNLIPVFLSGGGWKSAYEYDIDNLSGSYLDTPDTSLNTHYYTLYWDGRTGDANLSPRIHLNRPHADTTAFESRPISTLTIQEIYYPE